VKKEIKNIKNTKKQKAKALNEFATYKNKPSLKEEIFIIKPIYEDLSKDELLTYCLGSFIQNNKKFNASVWAIAPKTFSGDKTIINIVINIAICNFNDELTSLIAICKF